jgi:phosphoglycolate phosphatase
MNRALLLDFDGTLADSSSGIYWSFSTAASHCGLEPPSSDALRSVIGPPVGQLFNKFYGDSAPSDSGTRESFISFFRSHYDQVGFQKLRWYDNVDRLFSWLRSREFDVAVVTNKPSKPTKALLKIRDFDQVLSAVVGIDALVLKGLPAFSSKADAISHACRLIGCPAANSLYVGDTLSDKTAANEAGVHFLAATYGFHSWSEDDLSETPHVASIEELLAYVDKLYPPIQEG